MQLAIFDSKSLPTLLITVADVDIANVDTSDAQIFQGKGRTGRFRTFLICLTWRRC